MISRQQFLSLILLIYTLILFTTPNCSETTFEFDSPMMRSSDMCVSTEKVCVRYNVPMSLEMQSFVAETAEKYGLEPEVVFATIQTESGYNERAFNGSCYGLMQINRCNFGWLYQELSVTNLYDPYQNIESGCFLLKYFMDKGYSVEEALVCYNTGSYGRTSSYSQHVLNAAEKIRNEVSYYTIGGEENV